MTSPLRRLAGLVLGATLLLMLASTGVALAHGGGDRGDEPTIYGHRGASGYRPEHTLGSYRSPRAWAPTTSSPTSSRPRTVLVVRHEPAIGGTTDVADHPEFAGRRTTKVIDGITFADDWFTEDFTLAELKTLRAKERLPALRPRNTLYDGRYEIPTFQEVIDLRDRFCRELRRRIGLIPELKHSTYFRGLGLGSRSRSSHAAANRIDNRGRSSPCSRSRSQPEAARPAAAGLPLVQLLDARTRRPGDVLAANGTTTYAELATPEGLRESPATRTSWARRRTTSSRATRRRLAARDDVRARRPPRGPRRRPVYVPQREPVPPAGAAPGPTRPPTATRSPSTPSSSRSALDGVFSDNPDTAKAARDDE